MARNGLYLATFCTVSAMMAAYEGILWVDADSRTQPAIYRPFEHGWLAFFYWIPYLPYYFWRTRGAQGLLMLAGLAAMLFSGWIAQWIIYAAWQA